MSSVKVSGSASRYSTAKVTTRVLEVPHPEAVQELALHALVRARDRPVRSP